MAELRKVYLGDIKVKKDIKGQVLDFVFGMIGIGVVFGMMIILAEIVY
jgi:hypothetical protein